MSSPSISAIDEQIDANRAALIAAVGFEPETAAGWQDAWDAHPALYAYDCELFRQRGVAQIDRPEGEDERATEAVATNVAGPGYTVHYQHNIWDGRPFADPCTCRHPGPMAFPIGYRVERERGRNVASYDAIICMDCGNDGTGQTGLVEGLTAAYVEATRLLAVPFLHRTYGLVEHRRDDLAGQPVPLWMAVPLGLSRDQINEYVRADRARRAAEYMGARVARYAEAA